MVSFKTIGVETGSRWDKTITLGPYSAHPLKDIANIVHAWLERDPAAPARVQVFGLPGGTIEGGADDLLSRDYLGFY